MDKGKSQTHGGSGAKVRDPGGHTTRGETGGSIPGGTSHDVGPASKVTKGTV